VYIYFKPYFVIWQYAKILEIQDFYCIIILVNNKYIKPIKNPVRIKVQDQISPIILILVFGIILAILAGLIYISFQSSSSRSGHGIGELIALLVICIPLLIQNATNKEEYVSEMILSNKDLTLVYKQKRKVTGQEVIPLKDIKSFHAVLNANISEAGTKTKIIFSDTHVTIKTINGTINFEENSNAKFTFCSYAFMLNLLKIAYYIPHFSYEVKGNALSVKEEIEYFALHGRKMPFIQRFKSDWKKMKRSGKFATCIVIFFVALSLCGLGYLVYTEIPPVLNANEKQFMTYFNQGYEARQNEDYVTALKMFDKAEEYYDKDPELFYSRAYCYEKLGEYDKAISVAKEGLNYVNSKSIYKKAHKYTFNLHPDLYLYSVIGDSNYKLKNYREAKEANSYIITHGRNAWHYFQRGKCEYYLGEYKEAMSDFLSYKAEIEETMRKGYQWYDEKDLQQVQKWIDKTTEMMIIEEKEMN